MLFCRNNWQKILNSEKNQGVSFLIKLHQIAGNCILSKFSRGACHQSPQQVTYLQQVVISLPGHKIKNVTVLALTNMASLILTETFSNVPLETQPNPPSQNPGYTPVQGRLFCTFYSLLHQNEFYIDNVCAGFDRRVVQTLSRSDNS